MNSQTSERRKSDWQEVRLDEIVKFQRGHDLTVAKIIEGIHPVAGSNGIIGYHHKFTTKGPGVTLGRSGNSIGVAHYYEHNFWAHNTTLYSTEFLESHPKYVFYLLKTIDFYTLNSGSAVPSLNRNHIHSIDVKVPPLSEQKAIAQVLSSLDDKIDLLHRQNKTLEAITETLFRQWFIEEAEDSWEDGTIEDLFVLQRGFDLPTRNRLEGVYPIFAASGFSGNHAEFKVKAPGVTTGRSGLLGKVFLVLDDFWPLNTSLYIREFKKGTPIFSYFFLKNLDLEAFNAGSAVPTLNRNHVHQLAVLIPPKILVETFESKARQSFEKIQFNEVQIRTLEKLRDTLLPKLMSGEVRVAVDPDLKAA